MLEKIVERFLRKIRFNHLMERGGVMQAMERSGSQLNPVKVLASLVFWLVMFAVILIAANALGLQSLANVFSELVSYIPSVIAAVVIVIVGILLGEFVGGLITASAGALHGGPTLARVGRGGVIVIAVFMALQQLGVAPNIVTTAFAILFGAVAFALAIAFGLGNRDLAGQARVGAAPHLAHAALARHSRPDGPAPVRHLSRARELFDQVGAKSARALRNEAAVGSVEKDDRRPRIGPGQPVIDLVAFFLRHGPE